MSWAARAALAVALVGAAAFGFACSDDGGSLTLDDYFSKLQKLDDQFEEDSAKLDAAFESEDLDEIKSAFESGTESAGDFVDDLDALEAPDEAKEIHEEAVAAGNELVDALKDMNDAIQDADSPDALATIDFDPVGTASERFNGACLDLEALAADKDIELDLNCEEAS